MAKLSTLPVCLDEVRTITIGWLRRMGYLKPHYSKRGRLSWSCWGEPSGAISVVADTDKQFIELSYMSNCEPINYRIELERRPSNLGQGVVWYFICPATGKRCRTLYEYGDYFYSRYAFHNPFYSSQTCSKGTREWLRAIRIIALRDEFLVRRYSRTHYKGKPTRRYQRISDLASRIDPNCIARAVDALRSKSLKLEQAFFAYGANKEI